MVIEPRDIALRFASGINEYDAVNNTKPGAFWRIENAVWAGSDSIKKRPGLTEVSDNISGTALSGTTGKLIRLKRSLGYIDNDYFGVLTSTNDFIKTSRSIANAISSSQLPSNISFQTSIDTAGLGTSIAYIQSQGETTIPGAVDYTILDGDVVLVPQKRKATAGYCGTVLQVSSYYVFFWAESNVIKYAKIGLGSTTETSTGTLFSDLFTGSGFSTCKVSGTNIAVVYRSNAAGNPIRYREVDTSSFSVVSSANSAEVTGANTYTYFTICYNATSNTLYSHYRRLNGGNEDLVGEAIPRTTFTPGGLVAIITGWTGIDSIGSAAHGSNSAIVVLNINSDSPNFSTATSLVLTGGTVIATETHTSQLHWTSKPFQFGGQWYAFGLCGGARAGGPGSGISNFSHAVVNLNHTGSNGRILPLALCNPSVANWLLSPNLSGVFVTSTTVKTAASVRTSSTPHATGTVMLTATLQSTDKIRSVECFGGTYVSGGFLTKFTGNRLEEVAFLSRPEDGTLTAANTTGALTSNKTYTYRLVWYRVMADGSVVRSSPSDAFSVTLGASDDTVQVDGPSYGLTSLYDDVASLPSDIYLEVYRTEGDSAGPFYLSGRQKQTLYSVEVTYIDLVSDATLVGNTPLYTGHGLQNGLSQVRQGNICPPSAIAITYSGNSLYVSDGQYLYASRPIAFGTSVEFTLSDILDMSNLGGVLSAENLDDRPIFIGRSFCGFVADGRVVPIHTGIAFPERLLSSAVRDGVLIVGGGRVYLLNRALQLQDLTYPAITTLSSFIEESIVTEESGAVFTVYSMGSNAVHFNLEAEQARVCTHTFETDIRSTARVDGTTYTLSSDGVVYRHDSASGLDGASWVTMLVDTGYFSPGNDANLYDFSSFELGYKRVSNCGFTIALYTDRSESEGTPTTYASEDISTKRLEYVRAMPKNFEAKTIRAIVYDEPPLVVGSGLGAIFYTLNLQIGAHVRSQTITSPESQ